MTDIQLMVYGAIESIKADIEGMKTENKRREMIGAEPVYTEQHFFAKSEEITNAVNKLFK